MKKYMCMCEQIGPAKYAVRNGEDEVRLGEVFGGATITKLEAYGRDLEFISPGLTAAVTFDAIPTMVCQSRGSSAEVDPMFNLAEADQLVTILESAARSTKGPEEDEIRKLIARIQMTEAYVTGHVC